jgi:hypothetical protein
VINQGTYTYTHVPVEFDGAWATQHVKNADYSNVTIEFVRDTEVLAWTADWVTTSRTKNNELLALGFGSSSLYIKTKYKGEFSTFTKTYSAGDSLTLNLGPYNQRVYSIHLAFRDIGINSSTPTLGESMEAVGTNLQYYYGLKTPSGGDKPNISLNGSQMLANGSNDSSKKVRLWRNASSNPNSYRVQFVGSNRDNHTKNYCRLDALNDYRITCDLDKNDTDAQPFVFTQTGGRYYLNAEVDGVLHPCRNSGKNQPVLCNDSNTESNVYLRLDKNT